MEQKIFITLALLVGSAATTSCGKKDDDRGPYSFEVERSCYNQGLVYVAEKNACGDKAAFGLLDAGVKNNYLECKGYIGIPNPGAYCNLKEAEIVQAQATAKKITVRYSYIADLSKDPPVGEAKVPSDLMPNPVLVSDTDNVERSFVKSTKVEEHTITVTGKGPFRIVDLNAPKAPGYWLEASSGLAISDVKIEDQ